MYNWMAASASARVAKRRRCISSRSPQLLSQAGVLGFKLRAFALLHRIVADAYHLAGSQEIIPKYLGNYNL
jgi:hypothetical protein